MRYDLESRPLPGEKAQEETEDSSARRREFRQRSDGKCDGRVTERGPMAVIHAGGGGNGAARPEVTSNPMVPPSKGKMEGRAEGLGLLSRLACS